MKGRSKHFGPLREYCETVPIVDCHDHTGSVGPKYADPIQVVASGYFASDLHSAIGDEGIATIHNGELSIEDRWPVLEEAWKRCRHTGYAQVTRRVLKKFYDVDDVTLDGLKSMAGRLLDLSDEKAFDAILGEANIVARIGDVWPDTKKVLDGTLKLSPRTKLAISLPGFHSARDYAQVQSIAAAVGKHVTSLDEYLDVCRETFDGYKRFGAVTFKDQSAYNRTLAYGNPARAEAETLLNAMLEDPRKSPGYPDGNRALDDFLFHELLRMARDIDLPVQIHTGHMAGVRNDIVKTNAVQLIPVLELHRQVRFDLFHANWPYGGELMYLGKNYPNVSVDFCWANIIDPIYCQDLFKQAISSMPHGKIHGYGSDYGGSADRAWAHASIARDNIAIALSDLIDLDWLDLDDAKQIARMWLFENANEFFRLGLKA